MDQGHTHALCGDHRPVPKFGTADAHLSAIGAHETRDDLHEGALARTVLAEQDVDLTLVHAEVDVLLLG